MLSAPTTDQVRAVHTVTELVHAILYLCPEANDAWEGIGLEPRGQGYVAGRAAPMGAVGPEMSIATFYNFNPALHRYALPAAWEIASPEQVLATRAEIIQSVYERVEAPTDGLDQLADLAVRAADGLELAGRPLAAANAGVPLPEQPFARAWQALTVLREHRGDGHVALLTAAGLDQVEVLVAYAAWQGTVSRRFLQMTRGWDDDAWAAAEDRLRARGWLDEEGALTTLGRTERDRIESQTDELGAAPYITLGADDTGRLFDLARPLAQALNDNGGYKRPAPMPDAYPA